MDLQQARDIRVPAVVHLGILCLVEHPAWPVLLTSRLRDRYHTIESTREALISLTILLGWLSRSLRILSMTDISVAVVSCSASGETRSQTSWMCNWIDKQQ